MPLKMQNGSLLFSPSVGQIYTERLALCQTWQMKISLWNSKCLFSINYLHLNLLDTLPLPHCASSPEHQMNWGFVSNNLLMELHWFEFHVMVQVINKDWCFLYLFVLGSCYYYIRAESRFAPNQWEMALLCNNVSHWLDASLESALLYVLILFRSEQNGCHLADNIFECMIF